MVWILLRRHGLAALAGLSYFTGRSEAASNAAGSAVTNVAIIGAGAAGSSTAYHLRQFADEDDLPVNITIFEKSPRAGGRSLTVNALDNPMEPVELGATIFVEVNHVLYSAVSEFNLSFAKAGGGDGGLGIWDGERFRYRQSGASWGWWEYARLFWKYGLAPYNTQKLVQGVIRRFLEMYQAPHFPFRSLTQKAEELELTRLTGVTGSQFLDDSGITPEFAQDIIQASTRVNYATNLAHIHGLETMVSMASEGAVQVAGGNWQIFDNMVKSSSAAFHPLTTVTSIELQKDEGVDATASKYTIATQSAASEDQAEVYPTAFDKVVVAGPWQYSGIEVSEDLIQPTIDEIPYVQLHVTLFTSPSKLSPGFFNLPPGEETPTTILTTMHHDDKAEAGPGAAGTAGFFSVSTSRVVSNPKTSGDEYVYKIFSPAALDAAFLSKLRGVEVPETIRGKAADGESEPISWYYPHIFHSYPIELPRVTFQDPILRDGLYYTSGMESFISTMETNALMGKNVAKLIANDLAGRGSEAGAGEKATEADTRHPVKGDEL